MTQVSVLGAAMCLCQTTDPWYNKPYYLRAPAPWDKRRQGWAGLSGKQVIAASNFAAVQTSLNDKGLTRWQRRTATAKILRGMDYGGAKKLAKRSPVSKATVDSAISAAVALIKRA